MATLGAVILAVAREFNLDYEQVDENEYNLTIRFDDDRSQGVNAIVADDPHNETWVVITSEVGDIDDLDPVELLERNSAPGYTFVAVDEGRAKVYAQLPLAVVSTELCRRMLFDVAAFADALEEELLGSDDA